MMTTKLVAKRTQLELSEAKDGTQATAAEPASQPSAKPEKMFRVGKRLEHHEANCLNNPVKIPR